MSKNKLGQFPVILSRLKLLRSLKLNDNEIATIGCGHLVEFLRLETLEVRSNKLKSFCDDFGPSHDFALLPSLRSLDLCKNSLSELSPALSCMPKLSSLSLSLNQLKGIEPLLAKPNSVLDTLVLSDNKIDAISSNISHLCAL